MSGFNLQTYLEEYISQATGGEISRADSPTISSTEIARRINGALSHFHSMKKPVRQRVSSALVSGDQRVRMPFRRQNTAITSVHLVRSDGNGTYELQRISEDDMERIYDIDDTSDDQGDPVYWCVGTAMLSATNRDTIIIRPIPTWSDDDGVIFRFSAIPEQLWRVENTITKYLETTFGSKYCYIYPNVSQGGNGATEMTYGDEIGIVETSDFAGTSLTSTVFPPSARFWYTIANTEEPASTTSLANTVTNGTFTGAATGWTLGAGAAYNSNNVTFTGAGTMSQTQTNIISGTWYRLEYTVSGASSPSLTVTHNGTSIATASTDGTQYAFFQAGVSAGSLLFTNTTGNITIDSVSIYGCTRVELDRVYAQASMTDRRYLGAQVPDMEYAVPGSLGYAPVYFALHQHFLTQNAMAKAQYFLKMAMDMFAAFIAEEPGDDKLGYSAGFESTVMDRFDYWPTTSG